MNKSYGNNNISHEQSDDDGKSGIAIGLLNTLFIIAILFLHHIAYTPYYFEISFIPLFLQKLSVGGFLFLSGYKLSKSKSEDSVKDFAVNRFFRVYLLYIFGIIIFSFTAYPYMNKGHLPSYQNFIMHALCLQAILPNFLGNNYFTLWFFGVLFYCYCFFLFTRKIADKSFLFVLLTLLNICMFFLLSNIAKKISINLFQPDLSVYLIFFALGMIFCHQHKHINALSYKYYLFLFCVGFISMSLFYIFLFSGMWYNGYLELFFMLISTIPFYLMVFKISAEFKIPNPVLKFCNFISYSSFCVFLFHRSLWSVMAVVWYEKTLYQFLYIVLFGTLLIFVFSYCMQRTYNSMINSVKSYYSKRRG